VDLNKETKISKSTSVYESTVKDYIDGALDHMLKKDYD